MAISSSGISFSGLASGIDSGKLIEQLVALESIPIKQLEAKKAEYQAKLSAVGTLKGLVKELQKKAEGLATKADFLSFRTSVSQEGFVEASATGSATPGSHSVTVNALATIDRWTFDAVADQTVDLATVDGQKISFTVDGTSYDVPVTAAESSLEDIAAAVNSVAGEKVAASVVNVGTSSSPSYQLVLTSKSSGQDNRISGITNTIAGLTIDATGPNGLGVAQSANNISVGNNAEAVIDGLTVTRETNEFTDVVTGLSLTLQAADPATTLSISVEADTGAIKSKVKEFVETFNKLVDFVNAQNSYNQDTGPGGKLFGDPILRDVLGQVRAALFNVPTSVVQADTEGYSTLQLVGIKTQSDGKLQIDSAILDDKLEENLELFADLFIDSDGFDNGGAAENTPAYYTDTTEDSGLADTLDRAIDKMLKTYTGPNGNTFKGLFDARAQTYNDNVTRLLKDIDAKELHVEKFHEGLVLKFAKLEEVMGGLQAQGASLQAALSGLIG